MQKTVRARGEQREEAPQGAGAQPQNWGSPKGSLPAPCPFRSAWVGGSERWTWRRYLRGGNREAWRKGGKGRLGDRPGGASHSRSTRCMGPGRGCGEAGRSLTPARGCAARARPRRLRAALDRTPPTPGWAVPPFGPAAPLRLLSAAAAGRLPRSSPALSRTAPRPAHRQPPPDLLLPTWPPPPPALGSFRRQEPETSETTRNGRGTSLLLSAQTMGEFRKLPKKVIPGDARTSSIPKIKLRLCLRKSTKRLSAPPEPTNSHAYRLFSAHLELAFGSFRKHPKSLRVC